MALVPKADAYAANVVLLLPFDEDLTDYSASPKTATPNGDAAVSALVAKFGDKSLLLDGTGDFLSLADNDAWNFGNGNFTIEAWVRWAVDPGTTLVHLITQRESSTVGYAWAFYWNATAGFGFAYSTSGTSVDLTTTTGAFTPVAGTWYHVAVSRVGTSLRVFANGVAGMEGIAGAHTLFNSTAALKIGAANSTPSNFFPGNIDEVRITKGVGRYSGNFTPPESFFQEVVEVRASFASLTPLPVSVFAATHSNIIPITAAFASGAPLPQAVFEATHIPFVASFSSIAPIPFAVFEVAHFRPIHAAFASITPLPASAMQGLHPYNEGSELLHNTLIRAPLVKTERNIRFTGSPL